MLERKNIERAVDVQQRAYRLLVWMKGALDRGFIAPEAAGQYASREDASLAWLEKHLLNFPENARPEPRDLRQFGKFFATYLTSSFDLEATPGENLYSPGGHCFCPICSWMVRAPHIRPKKVTTADKKRAEKMKANFLDTAAAANGRTLPRRSREQILQDPEMREALALCAYAADLLHRMMGAAQGPATLALWRSFAWTAQGSPRKDFVLSADQIMKAQEKIVDKVSALGQVFPD